MRRKLPMIRNWEDARAKVDEEGVCRYCRKPDGEVKLEAAHTLGRDYDEVLQCPVCEGTGEGRRTGTKCGACRGYGGFLWVDPGLIVPLCGPATSTSTCHGRQHGKVLDLLSVLTGEEQIAAVAAVVRRGKRVGGSGNIGIAQAYRRLTGKPPPDPDEESISGNVTHVTQQPSDQRSIYALIEQDIRGDR